MKAAWQSLRGWKTYCLSLAVIIATGCYALGYIDQHAFDILVVLLGGGGLAALRHAVSQES